MKPDGDLAIELRKLDDYHIRSRKDARAICAALGKLSTQSWDGERFSSPLHALVSLFQDVEDRDAPAFDVLYEEGLPQLIRIFDATIQPGNEKEVDDLLLVLKVLAMYGSREGAEKVVEAARRPLKPDGYMWHVIMCAFCEGHPHRDYVFEALSDPLPPDFIAVALLDSANTAAFEGAVERHPFDSLEGWNNLEIWLKDCDPEHFSYAHSATAALPFVSNPARDQLLALAMDHVDAGVQMEGAWAAGRLGREGGLQILSRFCLDVNHSDVAQRYLAELDRRDLIPAEATEPSFQAMAEFARWLAHPNELGQPPDELEVVDHRRLAWPPDRELKPFWLIRYRLRDQTGLEEDDVNCGLVGSVTWCFFLHKMHVRPPEDAYAIHCCWEMEHVSLIDEAEVTDASEYAAMLEQWQGACLQSPTITRVAELSPKLTNRARLVALASAKIDGVEGWVVLDGSRSTWYPKDEQPDKTHESNVLKIHVGRQLLGFDDQPDRKKYFVADRPRREPQQIITAYENLMIEAATSTLKRQKELLGSWSPLLRHFDAYVDALVEVNGAGKPETVIEVYERFLGLAAKADDAIRDDVYDSHCVLGEAFDTYVEAIVSCRRSAEVVDLIEFFAPHWDHNLGYGRLGRAAFKADRRDVAERFFLKLQDGLDAYYRFEEMSRLAEIWHDRGDVERARELLVDCMRKLVDEIQESEYNSDRRMFADEFQVHRSTYLRLSPDGENELAKLGVPSDPL
jgi:hypothetical protein